ncbi:MAG: bifunctional UDP-N-acetylglucosamine diphosphorylase/glucosamine-1-phosphate N-acetyltransferase GlmU [Candidatus Aminicenantes bacterium]|nr:bifunctional UDP-N-acetylglucosamine diphosphorylase/glucosamine-1-phosphate N-acetyltransferase GlmU [Candidatus Aminicenantes bacterium]
MSRDFVALVLAAGQGTRFRSRTAKLLHPLLGRPMIRHMTDTLSVLKPAKLLVVVGHQREDVVRQVADPAAGFVIQKEQRGSGHAVLAAAPFLRRRPEADILVVNGDLPLVTAAMLRRLLQRHRRGAAALTFLTAELRNPFGFGRVIREGKTWRIVEEKDATAAERRVRESNIGAYVFRARDLLAVLPRLSNKNKKKEYYLTDTIEELARMGRRVAPCKAEGPEAESIIGVNTRFELAQAAEALRRRKLKELAEAGVTFLDPARVWIDWGVRIGRDTTVYPGVTLEGETRIGSACVLHPGVHIRNVVVGNGVAVLSHSVLSDSRLEDGVRVGPFAHLRMKTVLRAGARAGNFVEMKNTDFGREAKAMHLTYLGDAEVGEGANIGAGTITCNYDGERKNRTRIGAGAFIGSGTELVAPIKVGRGAYVGAGSVITKDVSPGALAVSRARQFEKPGWAARLKDRRKASSPSSTGNKKSGR